MRARTIATLAAVLSVFAAAGCSDGADDAANEIVRTTTVIAGAGVVGVERDTTKACPAAVPADTTGNGTRRITHAAGESDVPVDPQKIVVLSTATLDAVCALGLWERVAGAATLDGPESQPAYLGSGIAQIPSIGTLTAPDPARIEALHPDLIIGSTVPDAATQSRLSQIAPTVYVGDDTSWQLHFESAADALGRGSAARQMLADYRIQARDTGDGLVAGTTEASLVRFGADDQYVLGGETFAGKILSDIGARRPADQRGASFGLPGDDLAKAEGDLIYVMFQGQAGKDHGLEVMESNGWKSLGAAEDKRVFAVDDTIWSGGGIVAARSLLKDLSDTLNGYTP